MSARRKWIRAILISLVIASGAAAFVVTTPEIQELLPKAVVAADSPFDPPVEAKDKSAPPPKQPVAFRDIDNAALALSLADLRTIPEGDALWIRYVYFPMLGPREDVQALSLVANMLSTNPLLRQPPAITNGKALALRINLKHLVNPNNVPIELDNIVQAWESLQFEPRLNLLLTKDTLQFAGVDLKKLIPKKTKTVIEKVKKTVPAFVNKEGKVQEWKWEEVEKKVEVQVLGDNEVLRVVSEHLDKAMVAELIERTQSQAPVVSAPYFVFRSLSTVKDKGVYRDVWGGLYYDLSNTPTAKKKGSDEDALLRVLGVGDADKGLTAREVYDLVGGDKRSAMFRSNVTSRPRMVETLQTLVGKLWVTHDVRREDVDIARNAMLNLGKFEDVVREIIYEKANGLHGFVLVDAAGKLQEAAPSNVVADRTVPSPFSTDLQGAISCIRCHALSDALPNGRVQPGRGLRFVNNEVNTLLKGQFDVIADLAIRTDAVERLAAQYSGDFERGRFPMSVARDSYSRATLEATGPWQKPIDPLQLEVVKQSSDQIAKIYGDYWYRPIDARQFLLERGITCDPSEDAAKLLAKLMPPSAVVVDGRKREDGRIMALVNGIKINRADADLIGAIAEMRLMETKR